MLDSGHQFEPFEQWEDGFAEFGENRELALAAPTSRREIITSLVGAGAAVLLGARSVSAATPTERGQDGSRQRRTSDLQATKRVIWKPGR